MSTRRNPGNPLPSSAVALRYEPAEGDLAPKVIASGTGFVAEQIFRLAKEHDVPIREDPALASALSGLDIGASIPPELFRAVAEILAFIYRMNGKSE
jgi:flagellar biosynthesis protein